MDQCETLRKGCLHPAPAPSPLGHNPNHSRNQDKERFGMRCIARPKLALEGFLHDSPYACRTCHGMCWLQRMPGRGGF